MSSLLQVISIVPALAGAPIQHTATISTMTDFTEAFKISRKSNNLPPTGMRMGSLFPWICWNIWLARNRRVFDNRHFTPTETISKATELNSKRKAIGKASPGTARNHCQFVINMDAAWNEISRVAGLSWIFSNSTGDIIMQGYDEILRVTFSINSLKKIFLLIKDWQGVNILRFKTALRIMNIEKIHLERNMATAATRVLKESPELSR
ncbi:hypothetical protein BRARA_G00389 [Brassica rapa]|uniref:RNase H type-1 domain-containing protein n=1 Tax=Brassica campestris TaxID=3711 RepID=A0A397YPK9_BRACM|nr:hypothetical protein BRARA_G00389 [Brassica rapa]